MESGTAIFHYPRALQQLQPKLPWPGSSVSDFVETGDGPPGVPDQTAVALRQPPNIEGVPDLVSGGVSGIFRPQTGRARTAWPCECVPRRCA
jgi:hypothetical protein